MIDSQGRMLGICVPMNPQSQAIGAGVEWYDSGIGFAVPLAGADELIERLKRGERISPAFLGIVSIANPDDKGMYITRVVQNTPASEAGLLVEDIILELDGKPVNDMLVMRQILTGFESGQTVKMKVLRSESDEPEEIELQLGTPPQPKGEENQLEAPKIR